MDLLPVLLAVVGLVVGAAIGVVVGRRTAPTADRVAERHAAERRLADAQGQAQRRLDDAERGFSARLADREEAWSQRLADAERAAGERVADVERRAAEQLRETQEAAQLRVAELKADTQRVSDEFAALSAKALEQNSERFLQQAEERFKRAGAAGEAELAKREEAVRALVEPLAKTLGDVRTEMTSAERARVEAHGALAEQVRAMQTSSELLRTETSQLVTALRAPQVRGRWGELQLRRVVEVAGMLPHVDFKEQESVRTDEGLQRPDLVVNLPGDKQVVVDSKVAFNGYLEAMEATDEAVRGKRLAAHARHVRDHIDSLGAKAYWEAFSATPEFVVMFVPADTFLNAALEQDPTLWERAFEKNVVIATPATLVALLKTVGYTWRQEKLAAEAQQVFEVGRELHKRLATFGGHLTALGKRLNATVEQFNKLNTSVDSQLVTQVRRFSALQGLDHALGAAPPIEVLAVPAGKPDLYPDARRIESAADAERRAVLDGDDDPGLLDLGVLDLRPSGERKQA